LTLTASALAFLPSEIKIFLIANFSLNSQFNPNLLRQHFEFVQIRFHFNVEVANLHQHRWHSNQTDGHCNDAQRDRSVQNVAGRHFCGF